MLNMHLQIKVDNYDLKVKEYMGKLFVEEIKTRRQRKFRYLIDFYREVNDIKVNQIDRMLESFSRAEVNIEEKFKEDELMLNKLGINKSDNL